MPEPTRAPIPNQTCATCHFWRKLGDNPGLEDHRRSDIDGLEMYRECTPAATGEMEVQMIVGWPASALGGGGGNLLTARHYGCNMHEPVKGGALAESSELEG